MAGTGNGIDIMLIWVVALHCEAKPLISHYGLKKCLDLHSFEVYRGNSMICIICGIGKINAAAATAWIAALSQASASIAWINIGTTGSAGRTIGTLLRITRIRDAESGQVFYPVPVFNSKISDASCKTLGKASFEYEKDWAYDMEASAFFETACRFSSAELVQCLKIVSDNPEHNHARDKHRISSLISSQIPQITNFATRLTEINAAVGKLSIPTDEWQNFLALAHFSETEKNQLAKLLRFLQSRDLCFDDLRKQFHTRITSTTVLFELEKLCAQYSENL